MRKIWMLAMVLIMAGAVNAPAKDIKFNAMTQSQFKDLSKEAGVALSFHNAAPSITLGVTGFDLAVEASAIEIQKGKAYWQAAFAGDAPDFLLIPRVRARKGLPMGIDLGAMYAYVPDSNVKLFGVEVAKALIDGGILTPTLGLRGSYSKLVGVDELDVQTFAADLNLSKGFAIVTPYGGVGLVQIVSKPKGPVIGALQEEKITQVRYFGGLKLSPMPLFSLTGEVEYAVRPTYSLKAAINF